MQSNSSRAAHSLLTCLCALLFVSGCGGGEGDAGQNMTVTGTVQFDGSPLQKASVQFMSKRTGATFSADLTENGDYRLELLDVQPGETFDVAVGGPSAPEPAEGQPVEVDAAGVPVEPSPPPVPGKYLDPSSSGLSATLSDESEQTFQFSLSSS